MPLHLDEPKHRCERFLTDAEFIRKAFGSGAINSGLLTVAERLLYEGFLRR